jgi:hypothetical protein
MAKKNSVGKKSADEIIPELEDVAEALVAVAPATQSAVVHEDVPQVKTPKPKATEDPGATGSVGLGDIRKAVAFANSVGGLDKAIALLQIVKVAKEVQ